MSVIAFKIEDDRIVVGADGRCMNGDNRIITEDFKKIKLINDDTIFGSVGLAMTTDMFAEYLETTSYDSSDLNNNNDFMRIMYGFQKWLSDEFGWDGQLPTSLNIKDVFGLSPLKTCGLANKA